jgi:hypothetical protein
LSEETPVAISIRDDRRRRRMYTGAVPLRNSRGPYYIHVSGVCYGYKEQTVQYGALAKMIRSTLLFLALAIASAHAQTSPVFGQCGGY